MLVKAFLLSLRKQAGFYSPSVAKPALRHPCREHLRHPRDATLPVRRPDYYPRQGRRGRRESAGGCIRAPSRYGKILVSSPARRGSEQEASLQARPGWTKSACRLSNRGGGEREGTIAPGLNPGLWSPRKIPRPETPVITMPRSGANANRLSVNSW